MIQPEPDNSRKERGLITIWSITFLILFPVLISLGLLMRIGQAEMKKVLLTNFYSSMTLHGIGMTAIFFSFAFAIIWYLIGTRFVRLNIRVGYFVYFNVLIAMVGLAIGILIGKFAPGWHLLYPLSFRSGTWLSWSTGVSTISLIILNIAWVVGILHLLYSLSRGFGGAGNLLGWQYLSKKENTIELPPIVLVTTISLVPAILAFLTGAVMLFMFLLQFIEPGLKFDALLLENITLFFGHTFINVTMFCGMAWVYALLPEFTEREWKTDKALVYFWNVSFLVILLTWFQNLYIDFVKPLPMQYTGQTAAYLSAIPASIITMFGLIIQVYHSRIKWSIIPLMLLLGMAGWAIGSWAAAVESVMAIYKVLRNTMWVPAHFHTAMLMGMTLFIFAFLFYYFFDKKGQYGGKTAKTGFWLFVAGGYGFVLMFYLGGISSIPLRYARYTGIGLENMHDTAVHQAQVAVFFIVLLLAGLFTMYFSLVRRIFKQK